MLQNVQCMLYNCQMLTVISATTNLPCDLPCAAYG